MNDDDMTCAELVERVTDYLEGVVGAEEAQRLKDHLDRCDGCEAYVAQMRKTIRAAGALPPKVPTTTVETGLLKIYQEWLNREQG